MKKIIQISSIVILYIIGIFILPQGRLWAQENNNKSLLFLDFNQYPPSKFKILARKSHVIVHTVRDNLPSDVNEYDGIIIRFSDLQGSYHDRMKSALINVHNFVKNGGILLFSFNYWSEEMNDILLDMYGLGIVREKLIVDDSIIYVNGERYFEFWEGLRVGGYNDENARNPRSFDVIIPGYFESLNSEIGSPYSGKGIVSAQTNIQRSISTAMRIGNGKLFAFIEGVWDGCNHCSESIFQDKNFDSLDNTIALKRLIENIFLD